ncbi:MAG: DUF3164 family protein [Bacteroidetes bacterium]|nr:MAG: DUF3164 family protein [Bacteroidota bacterium]
MSNVTLANLSAEDKAALLKEMEAEQQAEKDKKQQYKAIVDSTVGDVFDKLTQAANQLSDAKTLAYNELKALLETKQEVYDVKNGQKTHTFTTQDGRYRIIIGVKMLTRWDGTESAGVEKVKQYITSLAKDENSANLTELVMNLLNPDKAGNLNPNRVMQLVKLKEKINNPLFADGVDIIMAAYAPVESKPFIEAYERDASGEYKNVELRFAQLAIPQKGVCE